VIMIFEATHVSYNHHQYSLPFFLSLTLSLTLSLSLSLTLSLSLSFSLPFSCVDEFRHEKKVYSPRERIPRVTVVLFSISLFSLYLSLSLSLSLYHLVLNITISLEVDVFPLVFRSFTSLYVVTVVLAQN